MWLLLLWSVILCVALTLYFRQKYSIFKNRGLKYTIPVPVLGNLSRVAFGLEHVTANVRRTYSQFPNERFYGGFEFMIPVVFIRDLELIKQITIKDAEHFLDHRTVVDDKIDPFWGRNLISLKGHEWKDMRSTLSPAFTSSKIRQMVPFMIEVGDHMVQSIKRKIEETGTGYVNLDTKDLTSRYANDVIASCAFGFKVDSHSEPDNVFYAKGLEASSFKLKQLLIFFAYNSFPKLMSLLKIGVFSESTRKFFSHLISDTMRNRETNNIVRPDMIHLLLEAKKGRLSHDDDAVKDAAVGFATVEESDVGKQKTTTNWSEQDLIAQVVIFLFAGFETVSTVMSLALHELATNPDVQEKLVEEIREYHAKNNGQLDFSTLQSMKYMDMVVSEIMRLWPPGFLMDRLCIKDYNMGKPNKDAKADYIIRKGEGVIIPVWAIHRDPQYFPNPDKFDPERFSEENAEKIKPFTYIPFGSGPRNCIGSRFALCELKAILYQLLLHIEVCPDEKTVIPIRLDARSFSLRIPDALNSIRFKLRK